MPQCEYCHEQVEYDELDEDGCINCAGLSTCCGAGIAESGHCTECGEHASTEKEEREYNEERKKEGL